MSVARNSGAACGAGFLGEVNHGDEIGPCPSCGAAISSSSAPNPNYGGQIETIVMHPIPFCDYFGATSAETMVHDMLLRMMARAGKA